MHEYVYAEVVLAGLGSTHVGSGIGTTSVSIVVETDGKGSSVRGDIDNVEAGVVGDQSVLSRGSGLNGPIGLLAVHVEVGAVAVTNYVAIGIGERVAFLHQ